MLFKKLITAAAAAGLLVSFSASMTACCNCGDDAEKQLSKELEKELDKEFEKMEKKAKTPKKVDKKADKMEKKDDGAMAKKADDKMEKKDDGGDKMAAGGGNAAVDAMTPDDLQAKVKKLGWKVISKPTKVNDKSITLSIVKGTTGGAASLNEFDIKLATDTFYKTMAKNEGAALARSGDKVVSVVMPGKKAEAEKLLKQLLEK